MQSAAARAYTSIANFGHGLDALGLCLDLAYDEVTARPCDQAGLRITITGDGADRIPVDPARNTAGAAVLGLLAAAGRSGGLELVIRKGISPGSGLGSSAASAVAAVVAADAALKLSLSSSDLLDHAVTGEAVASGSRHADNVAPALLGGFVVVDPGGELPPMRIDSALNNTDRATRLVVVRPRFEVLTQAARAALPREVGLHAYCLGSARTAMIVAAWRSDDPEMLARATQGSFVDAARGRLIPGFEAVCGAARSAGALGLTIGGAGPAVVAITTRAFEQAVASAMEQAFANHSITAAARVAEPGPAAHVVSDDSV